MKGNTHCSLDKRLTGNITSGRYLKLLFQSEILDVKQAADQSTGRRFNEFASKKQTHVELYTHCLQCLMESAANSEVLRTTILGCTRHKCSNKSTNPAHLQDVSDMSQLQASHPYVATTPVCTHRNYLALNTIVKILLVKLSKQNPSA